MIIVVGIPGCGKTSILKVAQKNTPQLQVANYGNKMLEVADLQKEKRDLLRKMPADIQKKIGRAAAQRIVEESNGLTIVDTHALIRTEWGFCPGLPKEVLEILSPSACVLVECTPEVIIQRRDKDVSHRNRDLESEEELSLHQDLSRSYLCSCCLWTGALFCILNNDSDSIEQNASPLIKLIQSFKTA